MTKKLIIEYLAFFNLIIGNNDHERLNVKAGHFLKYATLVFEGVNSITCDYDASRNMNPNK